jgi:hypothetical protein
MENQVRKSSRVVKERIMTQEEELLDKLFWE